MTTTASEPKVALAPSVRLLAVEHNVIRLRWGIWNFQEVTVDLRPEPQAVQEALGRFFAILDRGETAETSFDRYPNLAPVERANLQLVVTQLRQAGFLAYDRPHDRGADMARVLLGNLDVYGADASVGAGVAFTSDSPTATRYVSDQADMLGVKLQILPPKFLRELHTADFTSGMGGLAAADAYQALSEYLTAADAIVACISRASILTLRNINRLACHLEKPVVVGLIDGPFTTVVGTDSPRTGCLECFEQRSLARLEDHITYHDFAAVGSTGQEGGDERGNGIESLLCAFLVNEAVLLQTLGTSRFIGRALSIYLPTYEMQTQDVLRIASCPACRHVSRDILEEINFSSRLVIDQHVRAALGAGQ